uniref:Helitron_like_N domain-containing protein n=1 Tax=Steinernema glaseri TaxID=37863 RepID=A0A1I8AMF8_9BILA
MSVCFHKSRTIRNICARAIAHRTEHYGVNKTYLYTRSKTERKASSMVEKLGEKLKSATIGVNERVFWHAKEYSRWCVKLKTALQAATEMCLYVGFSMTGNVYPKMVFANQEDGQGRRYDVISSSKQEVRNQKQSSISSIYRMLLSGFIALVQQSEVNEIATFSHSLKLQIRLSCSLFIEQTLRT